MSKLLVLFRTKPVRYVYFGRTKTSNVSNGKIKLFFEHKRRNFHSPISWRTSSWWDQFCTIRVFLYDIRWGETEILKIDYASTLFFLPKLGIRRLRLFFWADCLVLFIQNHDIAELRESEYLKRNSISLKYVRWILNNLHWRLWGMSIPLLYCYSSCEIDSTIWIKFKNS